MSGLRSNNFQPVMADDTAHSQFNPERRKSGPLKEIIGMSKPVTKCQLDGSDIFTSQLSRTVSTNTSAYVSHVDFE
jgi:hypothetical protein